MEDSIPKYILNGELISKEDAELIANSPSFMEAAQAGAAFLEIEGDEELSSNYLRNLNDKEFTSNYYRDMAQEAYQGSNTDLTDSKAEFDISEMAFNNSVRQNKIDDSEFQTGVTSMDDLDDASFKDKFFSYLQNPEGSPEDKVLRKAALEEGTESNFVNNFLMETAVKIGDGGKHEILTYGGFDENGQPILKAIPYDKSVKKNVNTLSKYGLNDKDQSFIGVVTQNFVNTMSDTDDMAIFLADAVGDMTYDYIFDAHSPTTLDKIADETYRNKTKIERIDNPEGSEELFTSDWWASGIGSGAASILQFAAIGGGAGTVFRAMGMGAKTAAGLAKYSAGMLLNTAEGYEQAKAAGLSDKETSSLGLITGLVKTAIEATLFPGLENRLVGYEATKGIQDVILKETGGKLTKEAIKKAEKNILNKSLDFANVFVKSGKATNNFAAEGVKEFMEEFSQTYVDVIGQVTYDYMNADDPKFYTSFNSHSFKEALGAGAIGFLMGSGASVLPTKTRDISGQSLSETIYTEGTRSVNAGIKVLELKGEITPEKADNLRQKVAKVDNIIKANKNLFKKIRKETGGLSALITNQTINNINKAELLKQEIDTLREKPIERIDGETDANYNERVRERDEVISAKEDTINQLTKTFELFESNQKPFKSTKDKGVSELAGAVLSTINLADVVDSNMPLETKTILVNNDFNNKSNAILLANGTLKPSDNLKQAFEFIDNNDKTLETKDKVLKDFDLNFVERLAVGQYMFAKDLGKNLLDLTKSKEELIKKLKVQDKEKKANVKKKAEKIVDKDTKENIEEESESEGTIDELVNAINEKTNEESTVVSEEANNAEEGDNTLTGADLIDIEEGEEADVSEEQKLESENTETEVKSETLRKIYTDKFLALSKNILNSKYLSNIFTEEQIESVKNIDDLLELVFQVGNPLEILNNLLALSKGINTETEDIVDEEIESTEQFEQVPSLDNILTLQYPTSAEKNEDGKRKFAPIPFDLTVLYNGNFKKVEVVLERNEEEDKRINHNTWYDPIKNGVIEAVVYDKDGNRHIIGYLMASDNVYNKDSKNLQSLREHIAKGNNVKVTINKIIDQKLKTSTSSKHGKNSPHQVNTHGSGILYGIANRSSSGATYIDVPNKKDVIVLDAAGKAGNNYMLIPTMDGTAYFAAHLRMLKLSETPEFLQEVKEIIASYDGTNYEDIKDKLESMLVVNLSNNYGKPKIKVGKEWYDLDKAPIENLNHRLDKAKANTGSYNLELSKRGGVKTGLQQKQNLTGKVVLDPIFPETTVDTVVSKKEESVKLPISIPGLSTQGVKLNTPFEKILRELGWSDESISKMSFETQQQLVENKTKAPTVGTSSKIDINKENKKQEKLAELNAKLDKEFLEAEKADIEKRRQEVREKIGQSKDRTEIRKSIAKNTKLNNKSLKEAMLDAGYVEFMGVLIHPNTPVEIFDRIDSKVFEIAKKEGVEFFNYQENEGNHGMMQSLSDSTGKKYGIMLSSGLKNLDSYKTEQAKIERTNHIVLHELGHVLWETKLTEKEKENANNLELKSNYAKTVTDSLASKHEENYVENYAAALTQKLFGYSFLPSDQLNPELQKEINDKYDSELAALESEKEEPTKDTDNNDDILDDDDLGVAFSRVTDDNKSQWDKEKELAYIKEKLGDDQEVVVNTEKLLEIVKEAGGQDAWGLVKNSIIYLRDNAVKGTGYHEAFHVVFRYYLSDLEQAKLLGDRTEEQMAVLFEQYKVEREDMTLPAKVKEFFKNLYYTIYELFKPNNIKSLNHLFSQIDRGVFKDKTKRDVSRFKKEDVAYSIIKVGGLNPLQIKQRVSTLNNKAFKIYENTVRKNPELNGMSFPEFVNIVSSERGMEDLYRKAYKEIKDDFLSETDPEKKKQFKLFLSNIFRKENDQLVKGKLYELAIRDLQNYGINAKIEGLADKTQLLDEAISEGEVEELEQEQIGGWTVSNLSVDPRKTASLVVRRKLKGIPKYDATQPDKIKKDELGYPELMDPNEFYTYLLRNLSNSTKSSSILKKMEALARIKPEINFLLSELSNDETFSAAFYSNMKKASVNYISVVEGKNGTVTLSANKSNLENVIIAGWESNSFNKLFNTNGEVTERGAGIATEVFETLDELYESFLAELRNNPAIGKDTEIIKLIVNKAVRELDKIGLDISTADLNIDSIKGSKVKLISTLIGNGESAKTLAAVLSKGNNPFYGPTRTTKALKKLSELFKGSYKYLVQPSFMNMNNEPMYSYVMFNYLFKVREQIKENKQLYIQNLRRDPFYKYSPFLKLIETMSDDQIEEFDIGVADGINVDNTKNRYSNFSPSQLLQYTINSYHNNGAKFGWFRFPTISDKPNLPIVKMPKLNQADVIKGLHDVYKSESARMASGVIGNEQYDNKKGLFILLPYLNSLSKEDKKRLSNYDYFAKVTREYLETKFIEENGNLIKNDVKLPSNITEKILRDWFYNSVFYNTQLISIFAGDPAFYKNAGDIQKRMAQVWSPTLLIDDRAMYIDEEGNIYSPDSHYDVMYIDDVTYKDEHVFTNLLETFIKLGYNEAKAKSLLAPYNTTEVTDGQGFITLDRFRDIKIQYGEWGHIQERMYNKLQNGEYDESSVTTIFQTMKPFMFTHVWNEDLKKYIPTQHKNSEMVLLPQLAYLKNDKGEYINPELAKLLKFMTDNKLGSAQFKSVVKVGFRESYSWNEDYAYSENKRHRISSLDYGSQQNVPEHHIDHKNLLAVQARKLIISDLPDEGWPEGVTKEDIFREVQDIISSVIEDKYEIIEKSLLKDGEVNKTVLQNLLRDEISNRNSGIYAEYSTSLDENGEFIVPLFNPMTANKNQQLISAIIRNKVTKIKAPGPTLIQASAIGLSNMLEVKYNEEGGIDYYEAILPWWTKSLFPTNPDGTVDFSKLESLDILDAIGYRVPTEDKYSIIPIRPIAFLPPSAGGSILLPYSITTQTGADFDVDKLFLMTKSVMVKDGKISAYKYIQGTDEKSTTERYHAYIKSKARQELDKDAMGDINDSVWSPLKSLRDDNYKKFIAAFKERKKEIKKNALLVAKQKGIDRKDIGSFITLAIKQEYEQIWVPKFDEVTEKQTLRAKIEESSKLAEDLGLMSYEEFSALPVSSQNTEKARFNRLIDIIKSIYGNYRIIPQVGIPGGFDELKKLAANVRTLEGKNLNMDVALPSTQNEFTMRNSAGGDLIGVAANAKSNHAILQRFEMAFKSPIKFIIDGESESKKVISANQDYLKTAEISKVIAYTLAASVDNAKEPVAEDLNLNTLTLDVVVAIERVGFDFKLANYFVAQPIIKELVRKWRNKGGTAIAYREALSELYESFDSINDSIPLLSVEELTDGIGKKALFDEFQASVLQTFEHIKEYNGDPLSGLTLAMKYDGSGLGQTMAHSELIIDNFVKHFSTENPHIENADIMAYPSDTYKSMIKFYELGVVRPYNDILVKLFPYDSLPFITAKNSLKRLMGKSINPDVLNKMNNFVVSKVFNNFAFFQDLDTEYLIKSFPKEFKKAIRKKDSKLNMLDSFFIKRLNKFKEEVDTLELINSSSMLGSEKDNIKSIIDYILEEGNKEEVEQIENLIKYSYVTGGLTMSPNSVASVIPETIYETIVDEDGVTLSKFLHNNVSKLIGDSQYIFDDFVMNNPSVAKTIDLDALYVLGVYGKDNPKGFKLNINKSVMDEDGKFLDYLSVRTESGYSLFKYTGFKGIYVLADKKGMGNISELQRGRSIFNSNHTSADIEVVIKKLGNFSRIKDTVIQEGLPETFNTVKEVEEKIEDINNGLSESESDIELEGRVKRESEENKKDCN